MSILFNRLGDVRLELGINPIAESSAFHDDCLVLTSTSGRLGIHCKIASMVFFKSFQNIIDKFGLSSRKAAFLALHLQEVGIMWHVVSKNDELSADAQVAKWLGPLRSGSAKIAGLEKDSMKALQGLNALAKKANDWASAELKAASQTSPADYENKIRFLQEMGFDVFGTGFARETEPLPFIEKWWTMTTLLAQFSREAEKELMHANSAKLNLDGYIGKEKYTVGKWLPHLYTRVTGNKFGISKDADGDTVLEITGVSFVIACAAAIGIKPPAASTVAAYSQLYK